MSKLNKKAWENKYRKIPKTSPGAYIFQMYRFFFVFFVYEGNFQVQAPVGLKCGDAYMYIWRGLFSEFYGT